MENFVHVMLDKKFKLITPINYGYEKCKSSDIVGPIVRDFWLIHYVISGHGELHVAGLTHRVGPGQCFVNRPSEPSFSVSDKDDPWIYMWVGFCSDIPVPTVFSEKDVFDGNSYENVFLSMLSPPEAEPEAWLAGKIFELFSLIGYSEGKSEPQTTPAHMAKLQLEQRHQSIKIEELSHELHFNRTYLNTLFKREFGTSMQNYLLNYRLNRAAKLMQQMGYTPTQASAAVGYKDFYCFSKLFKKHVGLSPSEYIKRSREQISFYTQRERGLKRAYNKQVITTPTWQVLEKGK